MQWDQGIIPKHKMMGQRRWAQPMCGWAVGKTPWRMWHLARVSQVIRNWERQRREKRGREKGEERDRDRESWLFSRNLLYFTQRTYHHLPMDPHVLLCIYFYVPIYSSLVHPLPFIFVPQMPSTISSTCGHSKGDVWSLHISGTQ